MLDFGVTEKKKIELQQRMEKCLLYEKDLQEWFVRSKGPGGQNVNKTSTCVCLKHLPSGLEVKTQKTRSQSLNRFYARRRMCELLEEKIPGRQNPPALKQDKLRKQKDRRRRRNRQKSHNLSKPV